MLVGVSLYVDGWLVSLMSNKCKVVERRDKGEKWKIKVGG